MQTVKIPTEEKVRDNSASLAMFKLLQPRFREVKLSVRGWPVRGSGKDWTRLYLDLVWPSGGPVTNVANIYFDMKEGGVPVSLDIDFNSGSDILEQSAQSAWKAILESVLAGASFFLEPVFAPGKVAKEIDDYRNSYFRVTSNKGEIKGLFISNEIRAYGWQNYFPSRGLATVEANQCVDLITYLYYKEDALWRVGTDTEYEPEIVAKIEEDIKRYQSYLGVMG